MAMLRPSTPALAFWMPTRLQVFVACSSLACAECRPFRCLVASGSVPRSWMATRPRQRPQRPSGALKVWLTSVFIFPGGLGVKGGVRDPTWLVGVGEGGAVSFVGLCDNAVCHSRLGFCRSHEASKLHRILLCTVSWGRLLLTVVMTVRKTGLARPRTQAPLAAPRPARPSTMTTRSSGSKWTMPSPAQGAKQTKHATTGFITYRL